MDIGLVFKIGGVGILVAVIVQLLKQTGREDYAMLTALIGLVVGLTMAVDLVADLFDTLRRLFSLY